MAPFVFAHAESVSGSGVPSGTTTLLPVWAGLQDGDFIIWDYAAAYVGTNLSWTFDNIPSGTSALEVCHDNPGLVVYDHQLLYSFLGITAADHLALDNYEVTIISDSVVSYVASYVVYRPLILGPTAVTTVEVSGCDSAVSPAAVSSGPVGDLIVRGIATSGSATSITSPAGHTERVLQFESGNAHAIVDSELLPAATWTTDGTILMGAWTIGFGRGTVPPRTTGEAHLHIPHKDWARG
jgi:hypothetical protein